MVASQSGGLGYIAKPLIGLFPSCNIRVLEHTSSDVAFLFDWLVNRWLRAGGHEQVN